MTDYQPLMHYADGYTGLLLEPRTAMALVKRLRKVTLFVRLGVEAVTEVHEEDGTYRAYPCHDSLRVSAAQALKVLGDMADTNDRRAAIEKNLGRVKVARSGDCLFIG